MNLRRDGQIFGRTAARGVRNPMRRRTRDATNRLLANDEGSQITLRFLDILLYIDNRSDGKNPTSPYVLKSPRLPPDRSPWPASGPKNPPPVSKRPDNLSLQWPPGRIPG